MIAAFLVEFWAKLQKKGHAVPSDRTSSLSAAVNLVASEQNVNGVHTVHPAFDAKYRNLFSIKLQLGIIHNLATDRGTSI